MSERVISDPTVAGWELNPDTGYWMWAAGSDGSGGSIQDGDTEGQITTWDGDEWTPEGAVVVGNNGNTTITAGAGDTLTLEKPTGAYLVYGDGTAVNASISATSVNESGQDSINFNVGPSQTTRMSVDTDGNVNINGKLFVNGVEVGGGGGFWTEESPGVIKYTGTAKATTLIGTG